MNIVLTGSDGLIGVFLKERLEGEGHKIIKSLDIRSGFDITNIDNYEPKEKIDLFIHAAAHCKINESISDPNKTFHSNILGTYKIFEFCRRNKIPKIIYFSSSRVLSQEKNPYTTSKLFGEELCKSYWQCYGIKYVIIRPSTVYGPFWDETQRLMHKFIVNSLNGKDLEIYGNPQTKTLDFTYIDDFVNATILTIGEDNKEFDISGEDEFNVYELARFIIKETNSKSKIKMLLEEKAQPQKVKLDISAIKSLGYNPKVSILEGTKRTIEWYKSYLSKNYQIT